MNIKNFFFYFTFLSYTILYIPHNTLTYAQTQNLLKKFFFYHINFFWISSLELVRFSSLFILNKIRNKQARLCVSCFNKFGLALPLKPERTKRK